MSHLANSIMQLLIAKRDSSREVHKISHYNSQIQKLKDQIEEANLAEAREQFGLEAK